MSSRSPAAILFDLTGSAYAVQGNPLHSTGSVGISEQVRVTTTGSLPVVVQTLPNVTGAVHVTNAQLNVTGTVGIGGPITAQVTNFPTVQRVWDRGPHAVTGSVNVYTTGPQAISGTVSTYTQGPQLVSGTVTISGSVAVYTQGAQLVSGTVNLGNWPPVIGVSGSAPIRIFDTGVRAVSGSVSTYTQGPQAVSGSVSVYTQGAQAISGTVTAQVTGTVNLDRGNSTATPLFISGTVGVGGPFNVTGSVRVENQVFATSTGSLAVAITHWLGSALPSVGTKAASGSIPVTLPNDQTITVQDVGGAGANPSYYAIFDRIVPAQGKVMAALFNTSLSYKVVIYRISRYNWQVAAVTGQTLEQYLTRISAVVGATTGTIFPHDTSDVLPAGISAYTNPTVTESNLLRRFFASSEETNLSNANFYNALGLDYSVSIFERLPGARGLVLRNNEGVALRNVTNSTAGSVSYIVEFTVEPL